MAGISYIAEGKISGRRTGWLGPEDFDMANWKSGALACPRKAARTHSAEVYK
jgi:hypothetical protein